jgi:heptosyltransferase-2
VACARKVPAVVLFGPTSSAEIELYDRGTKVLPEGLDCLCCYLPRCDKQPYCMQLITPEAVAEAVERWLQPAVGRR